MVGVLRHRILGIKNFCSNSGPKKYPKNIKVHPLGINAHVNILQTKIFHRGDI